MSKPPVQDRDFRHARKKSAFRNQTGLVAIDWKGRWEETPRVSPLVEACAPCFWGGGIGHFDQSDAARQARFLAGLFG